jgi:hypothetical protein
VEREDPVSPTVMRDMAVSQSAVNTKRSVQRPPRTMATVY